MNTNNKQIELKEAVDYWGPPGTKLHPDLQEWVVDEGKIGLCIKHPLVYSILHVPELNHRMNLMYEQKLKMIEEAKATNEWDRIIAYHERPWRLHAFQEVEPHLSDEQYWESLRWMWTDSENIWQHKREWVDVLRSDRPGSFMDDEDKAEFDKLPDTFKVYRGYQKGVNFDGLSYTLDPKVAKFFSARFSSKSKAAVRERTVKKSDVFAYAGGRNEKEIIVLPRGNR